MASKKVTLNNGKIWKSINACQSYFRDIRDAYEAGEIVSNKEHMNDLDALLEAYDNPPSIPWSGPKKKCKPILHYSVDWHGGPGRSTLSFFIHYKDGGKEDFSFINAAKYAAE